MSQNPCEGQLLLHLIIGKIIKLMVKLKSMSMAPVYIRLQLPTGQYACCISNCYVQTYYLGIVYGSIPFDFKFLALFYSEITKVTVLSLYSQFYNSVKSQDFTIILQLRLIIQTGCKIKRQLNKINGMFLFLIILDCA